MWTCPFKEKWASSSNSRMGAESWDCHTCPRSTDNIAPARLYPHDAAGGLGAQPPHPEVWGAGQSKASEKTNSNSGQETKTESEHPNEHESSVCWTNCPVVLTIVNIQIYQPRLRVLFEFLIVYSYLGHPVFSARRLNDKTTSKSRNAAAAQDFHQARHFWSILQHAWRAQR